MTTAARSLTRGVMMSRAALTAAAVPVVSSAASHVVMRVVAPMIDVNPFHWAGDKVKETLADGFTSMMMALWSAGLWLIEMVFGVIDRFTTPDVSDPGLGHLYGVTLWMSFLVALVLGFVQVGLAALRHDGRSLGALAAGVAQYGAVVTGWVAVCSGLILGCTGLTRGLLQAMLHVDTFAGLSASVGMTNQVTGAVQAAVLGVCSILMLIPASFGYLLIMLVRESALLVLTATMPIAAAGALGEGTRSWMWRSIRWFVAACLTAPLLALVVGLGVQISRAAFPDPGTDPATVATIAVSATTGAPGSAPGPSAAAVPAIGDSSTNVSMAVVGSVIFLVACFCPMVLFRLLAFVDPGTASGASFRSTLSTNGGVSGLISGHGKTGGHGVSGSRGHGQGSGAATQVGADGRATSETAADTQTAHRFHSATPHTSKATPVGSSLRAAGKAAGGAMNALGAIASTGGSMSVDVMGQSGVGHQGYYDTTPPPRQPAHRPHHSQDPTDHLGETHGEGVGEDVGGGAGNHRAPTGPPPGSAHAVPHPSPSALPSRGRANGPGRTAETPDITGAAEDGAFLA